MILHLLCQYPLLDLIAMLEQLLDDVVTEDVSHQLQRVGLNLSEQLFLLVTVGSLELLLNEA